jgi:hypothetical protein
MSYALSNLTKAAETGNKSDNFYIGTVETLRRDIALKYARTLWARGQLRQKLDLSLKDADAASIANAPLRLLLRDIGREQEEDLHSKLNSDHLLVRLLAVEAVAQRRLHMEADLIERLDDKSDEVAQAARRALVQFARGTDFGPPPLAGDSQRQQAKNQWSSWLVLQQAFAANFATNLAPFDIKSAERVVLRGMPKLPIDVDPDVAALRDELLRAKGPEQTEVLLRLKDAKGVVNTEAIALAIPKLRPPLAAQARDALIERLTRMTAATLRDKFDEDDAEVRRAAALAVGRKQARELIPELVKLLMDSESAVAQAAHTALKDLSGKDFGPTANADRAARLRAQEAWSAWWQREKPTG